MRTVLVYELQFFTMFDLNCIFFVFKNDYDSKKYAAAFSI